MQNGSSKMWDVIVVGAGPAGCSAAYDLASNGRQVLLLDKSDFPRSKACAGGLTMKTVQALRYSIEPVTRQVVQRVSLNGQGIKPALLEAPIPFVTMTVRSEFDDYCFQKTRQIGAHFRRIRTVKNVTELGDSLILETDAEVLQTRFIIGADGVNSSIRRFCKNVSSVVRGFALEAQVPVDTPVSDVTVDMGVVRSGAGWIFPKGDHLNVGLFVVNQKEQLNRDRLMGYIQQKLGSNAVDKTDHVVGQFLGTGGWEGRCAYGRILLAGDAAGLTDALTGEGIYSAVVSGQTAAQAIDADLRGVAIAAEAYRAGLTRLTARLTLSARAARSFFADPNRVLRVLSLPWLSTPLMKVYARGMGSSRGTTPAKGQTLARRLLYGLIGGLLG
jgi:geranylgeranyl reductase family protein